MEGSAFIKPKPPEQVGGRAVTHWKNLDPKSRAKRVAEHVGSPVVLTRSQWALLAGSSTTGINAALNGSKPKPPLSPAQNDLRVLLKDVEESAKRIQWRSAEVERAALEDLDRLFGQFLAKHERALGTWRGHGGTTGLLAQAVSVFDRLFTSILSNNNL